MCSGKRCNYFVCCRGGEEGRLRDLERGVNTGVILHWLVSEYE